MVENLAKHLDEAAEYLWEDEDLLHVYGSRKDLVALTTRRLLFIDRSLFRAGRSVITVPYSRIGAVFLEKASFFSGRRKVAVQTPGKTHVLEFGNSRQAERFYDILADFVCRT
jgi:hypothetical protein